MSVLNRRGWMLTGAAVAATAAGAAVALWARRGSAVDPGLESLWQQSFLTPQGQTLAMAAQRGRPLLLNFWATWCPPCIEELPLLNDFYRQNSAKGWQVIGLAVDQPSAVRSFLQRMPLAFPVALAGMQGADLSGKLGNQAGGLPYSVVIGAAGKVLERKIGRLSEQELVAWSRLA